VDLLMYENKPCGLRHIFIEEAAEFIPQRLQPQHSKVYASLERLARMGRNARLGYTLINQRAEEVNKAILEISAFSLLHKQVGKNSLKSIQQWMELLQVENAKEIIHSLPALKQGECWVIGMNAKPHKIRISDRKTFHPDPKAASNDQQVAKLKIDVSSFVEKLNKQLQKPESNRPVPGAESKSDPKLQEKLQQMEKAFQRMVEEKDAIIGQYKAHIDKIWEGFNVLLKSIKDLPAPKIPQKIPSGAIKETVTISRSASQPLAKSHMNSTQQPTEKLGKCSLAILQFLASFPQRGFTKAQIGIATSYSPNSGGFNNALSELTIRDLIIRGERIKINPGADSFSYLGNFEPRQYSIDTYKDKLDKCEREIYEVLLDHPRDSFTKDQLADHTPSKYSYNSGGFNSALSTLNTLELIVRDRGQIRLNPELLEI
jgi:hypothetical protein